MPWTGGWKVRRSGPAYVADPDPNRRQDGRWDSRRRGDRLPGGRSSTRRVPWSRARRPGPVEPCPVAVASAGGRLHAPPVGQPASPFSRPRVGRLAQGRDPLDRLAALGPCAFRRLLRAGQRGALVPHSPGNPLMEAANNVIRTAEAEMCRPWPRHILSHAEWTALAFGSVAEGWVLLSHWAETAQVHALFLNPAALTVVPVSTEVEAGRYPALSAALPEAAS